MYKEAQGRISKSMRECFIVHKADSMKSILIPTKKMIFLSEVKNNVSHSEYIR